MLQGEFIKSSKHNNKSSNMHASKIRRSGGPGQPIYSVRQAKSFKRLVRRTTMIFCPSDSIYLKSNAILGTGLTVIQSQSS